MSIYFRFGEFRANSICLIFREGHAEFLYDFNACMHFYNQFVYYYHAGVHDGQWNDGGQAVAVGGVITHKYRGSQQLSRVEYSTQIY